MSGLRIFAFLVAVLMGVVAAQAQGTTDSDGGDEGGTIGPTHGPPSLLSLWQGPEIIFGGSHLDYGNDHRATFGEFDNGEPVLQAGEGPELACGHVGGKGPTGIGQARWYVKGIYCEDHKEDPNISLPDRNFRLAIGNGQSRGVAPGTFDEARIGQNIQWGDLHGGIGLPLFSGRNAVFAADTLFGIAFDETRQKLGLYNNNGDLIAEEIDLEGTAAELGLNVSFWWSPSGEIVDPQGQPFGGPLIPITQEEMDRRERVRRRERALRLKRQRRLVFVAKGGGLVRRTDTNATHSFVSRQGGVREEVKVNLSSTDTAVDYSASIGARVGVSPILAVTLTGGWTSHEMPVVAQSIDQRSRIVTRRANAWNFGVMGSVPLGGQGQ